MRSSKVLLFLITYLTVLMLTACSMNNITDGLAVMTGNKQVTDDSGSQTEETTTIFSQNSGEYTLIFDDTFTDGDYYYLHLSDIPKSAYQQIYKSLINHEETTTFYGLTDSEITLAYKCITFDHPELFYVDGYQIEAFNDSDKLVFRPNYLYTADEISKKQETVRIYTQQILQQLDETSDFTKLKSIYDYIISNTTYDISASDLQNILSVTEYGRAVCEGYAKATMYYANTVGLECIVVPGYLRKNGTAHMWNAVKLDDQWYYVDTTWGDEDFENSSKAPEIRYDYLCVNEEQLSGTHIIEAVVETPKCVATDMNYYSQMGKMVFACDENALITVLKDFSIDGISQFACSDDLVYQQVNDYLITNQHIFQYLPSKDVNIGYITNSDVRSFTFWIKTE